MKFNVKKFSRKTKENKNSFLLQVLPIVTAGQQMSRSLESASALECLNVTHRTQFKSFFSCIVIIGAT